MASRSKAMSRRIRLINAAALVVLVALILIFRLVEVIDRDRTPGERFTVAKIIDGDTVELRGGDRLRLLGIDTPEKDEPYYETARQFLEKIALGRPARVEYAGRKRDNYGRLLGYLYIDSVFVNRQILENGLGYLYLFKDNDPNSPEIKELLTAQREALKNHTGIWSLARTPEQYYVASSNSFRFHRPGCRSVAEINPANLRKFSTREEALYEGLAPCRNCKP
ncbi:MAG: thermonuclease family protein [Candidatus Zixiibacteriota bacterium]